MVAKISHGASLYGALAYNHNKVATGAAGILSGNRMISDRLGLPSEDMRLALLSFENYLLANRNTEKPVLHISLSPAPEDRLTDDQLAELADRYMRKMGYGDQPYIAYKHADTHNAHIHIVSVCVDEQGKKISDSYEHRRSMTACRELEADFGLRNGADTEKRNPKAELKKVDASLGDVRHQIGNTLKAVLESYRFQTFGEYSALLSTLNIEAKQVRGEYHGVPYTGIVYAATDDAGKVVSPPFKSSRFGKRFGNEQLEKRMLLNLKALKEGKWAPSIQADIARALQQADSRQRFVELLGQKRIGVVFRENEQGRIYGVTFIDHDRREVFNGSRMGKEFSANVFNDYFRWLDNILKEEQYDGEVSLYTYDKDGMLVKAENSENLLEFTRDRKTGQIIEEKQGEYTVNRTYDSEGNCTRITSSLGADIRHTYDREGNLQTMQAGESWQASWVRDNTGLEVQRTFSGGVTVRTERDCFGREVRKSVQSGGIERGAYRYQWGIANRLLSKENELTGTVTRYDYDRFDFLIRQETIQGSETDVIYRTPDFVGNLFETPDKKDRKYGAGGKLLEDPDCFYHYDDEGNLVFREFKQLQETGVRFDRKRMEKERGIRCLATGTGWLYEWASNGMLKKVIRPDGRPVEFRYDALGRRTAKQYFGKVTRWVWDGNVPIHEWDYKATDRQPDEEESTPLKEPIEDITTWVFEAGTFVPTAKIQEGKQYSIVSNYLGTPIQMYDEQGIKIWDCTMDVHGKITTLVGNSEFDCPFRLTGQYFDSETNLCYNRFRYYSPETGSYLSQDPIRLAGNNPTLYAYVHDPNTWLDPLGLDELYALVATKDGWYPIMKYGKKAPIGQIYLKEGDLWKIGTSKNASNRYSKSYLQNTGQGVELKVLHTGLSDKTVKTLERAKLKGHKAWKGYLPAGNKCCH